MTKKIMIAILIVIGILTAAAIGMLISVPSVLKSNTANLAGHTIMAPMLATSLTQ